MIRCQQCQTTNSLDSAFCKRCGTQLSADDLQEARSQLGRSVGQGFVKFNEGKIDEAAAIAEQAFAADPTLPEALSLKGMCHEHNLQIAEALECYERVLDINPNSTLDRIKVDQLRNLLSASAKEIPIAPRRHLAAGIAVAATLFVLAVGSLAAVFVGKKHEVEQAPVALVSRALQPAASSFPDTPATTPQSAASSPVKPADQAAPPATSSSPAVERAEPISAAPSAPSGSAASLPAVDPSTVTTPVDPKPFKVELVPDKPLAEKPAPKGVDPDPKPAETLSSAPAAQSFDSSVVEINVSNPKHVTGGAQEVPDTNSLQVLAHTASAQFQLRHYDSAAKAYERLLKSGGDPATVNQRLGQCYENLGKKTDAMTAYQRAIIALQTNINSGRGNATRERSALEACTQAVKVLQGS